MKKSTYLLMLVLCIFFVSQINAQSFIIKGGFNLSKLYYADEDGTYSDEFDMKPGFHVGGAIEIPLNTNFMFEPGIMLITKGVKMEEDEISTKANLNYIDIPLLLKASSNSKNGASVFGALGPYIGLGLNGKITMEYGGDKETEDVKFGNDEDNDDLKRLDMGVSIGGGVEFESFLIGVSYDYGLMNISPYKEYDTKNKNRVLKFTLGYRFGGS